MSEVEDERRPLVFRVNTNPNWHPHQSSRRSSHTSTLSPSDSSHSHSDFDLRHSITISPPPNRTISSQQPFTCTVRGSCLCILLCVLLERIAFHGLVGNFVLFLNKAPFIWVSYHAQSALLLFFGLAFLMAPVGGWIADSYLGRFKTVVLAFVIYIGSYALLPFIAENEDTGDGTHSMIPYRPKHLPKICGSSKNETLAPADSPFEERCAWLIYLVLIPIALADGFAKSNLGPFGSDQLAGMSSSTHLSFFNWYYWCSNLGAFVGLGVMAYIEQQISFHLGYIVCVVCLGLAFIVYVSGRGFYTVYPPHGSVITNILKIIREAWTRKRQRGKFQQTGNSPRRGLGVLSEELDGPSTTLRKLSFLDYAKHQNGGMFHNSVVNDVKKLKMIFAVFAALIPYWIVYYQMQTTFVFQGLHMKLTFSEMKPETDQVNITLPSALDAEPFSIFVLKNSTKVDKPELVAAWFTIFDVLFVIILLPLFDRVIYPRLARAGYPFTFAKRVVLGMVFSILAMIVAGVVEDQRLKAFWPYDDKPCVNACIAQFIANTEYEAANMSVLWQIPQYALLGISEVFASVAALQFAVSVAPKSMKALVTGIFYTLCGFGSICGTLFLYIFSESKLWFFNEDYGNINCRLPCSAKEPYVKHSCHLDYYFYFLGGLEVVGVVIFIYVSYVFGLNREHPLTHNTPNRGNVQQRVPGSESSS